MSIPEWPSTLPSSPLIGTQRFEALGQEPIETQFEYGNIELRPRSPLRAVPMTQTLVFSTQQFSTFRNFVENTLNGATSRFTYYFDDFEGNRLGKSCLFQKGMSSISAQKRGASHIEVRLQMLVFF